MNRIPGLLLLLVSTTCTPYAWFRDRVVDSGRSVLALGLIAGVALIEVFAEVKMTSLFYLWTVPAWLGWYLYAARATAAQPSKSYDPSALAGGHKATL
jgi:hypothetical protein